MSKTNDDAVSSPSSPIDESALIAKYCASKVTKQACREFLKEHGIGNIEKDALAHVYNPKDAEFTYQLLTAAAHITKAAKKKTLMTKHTKAAHQVYDEVAEALSETVASVTKSGMRQFAKEQGAQMVSSKAIDAVYDKSDPIITTAKWRAAVLMHREKSIADCKTLTPVFAETSNKLFDCYKNVFILEDKDGNEMQTD